MPAEFQKAVDYTLISLKNTYCFLDDILIVSKGSLEEHKSYVMNCLKRFDDENFRINLPKCHFGKLEIDWLGYHFSQSGISPLESKTAAHLKLRKLWRNSVLLNKSILTNNESRLKALNPYIHSYWRDLHVHSGCECIDEKVAIPNFLREALIEDIHWSHPGTWGMICMATHNWRPYMHCELIVKATECKPFNAIGKNLKSVIPAKKYHPHIPCVEPNQEIQISFGGPIFDEKGNEIYFIAAIDRFSKHPTAYI